MNLISVSVMKSTVIFIQELISTYTFAYCLFQIQMSLLFDTFQTSI
jgi:hypothetical protein